MTTQSGFGRGQISKGGELSLEDELAGSFWTHSGKVLLIARHNI